MVKYTRKARKGGGLGTSKPKSKSPILKKTKKVSFNEDPVSIVWKLSPQEKQDFYGKNINNKLPTLMTVTERKRLKKTQHLERMTAISKYNKTLKKLKELEEDIVIQNYLNKLQSTRKK
jgi:hypothetical protein